MKRALMVVHTKTFFPRMLELGRMLKQTGRYEPLFYLAYKENWPNLAETLAQLEVAQLGLSPHCRVEVASEPARRVAYEGEVNKRRRFRDWLPRDFRQRLARRVIGLREDIRAVLHLIRRRRFARDMVGSDRAALVVLGLDVATFDTCCFVAGARDAGVRSIVATSCTRPFEEALAVYYTDSALSCDRWLNRAVGRAYPHWQAEYRGKSFLLLPGLQVLARERLGLAPARPWIEGSSLADAVIAENEKFFQEGLAAGLDSRDIVLAGQLVHDTMAAAMRDADALRERLYAELGLQPGKPLILSSLLPDYGRQRPDVQFESYDEFLEFWIGSIRDYDAYNHVISLHPSMRKDRYLWLERFGARIASWTIAELIPLCHFYVTSESSTMSYAIAAGRPVLNFDAYRYRQTMFSAEPGVMTVEDKQDFVAALRRLATDPEFFRRQQDLQRAAAPRWGRLDGRAGERILALVDRLAAQTVEGRSIGASPLPDTIGIVAHDAGGAEILSSYARRNEQQYLFALEGPSVRIFERKLGTVPRLPVEDVVRRSDRLLCGTSWQSELELDALRLARAAQKPTVSFLDHWVNYRERFTRGANTILPSEIWVGDEVACGLANGVFSGVPVQLVPNPYFADIREELEAMKPVPEPAAGDVLYVCEPVRAHGLAQFGDADHRGYTEEEALRFFLRNVDALGVAPTRIVIRPHPAEPRTKYDWASKEFELPIESGGSRALLEEIAASSIVAGCESMAMAVAVITGKRVVSTIPPGGQPCSLPLPEIESLQSLIERRGRGPGPARP